MQRVRGALAGWRRASTDHGCLLKLQVAPTVADFSAKQFDTVEIALNDRQLRSLARDLARAASGRGVELHSKTLRERVRLLFP